MNSLEAELERKLDDPRSDARAGDLPKCGRREFHVRIAELRVVKSIKELRAKLKRRILTWPAERKSLSDGQIEIVLPRAIENSYPGVAEPQADRVVGAEKSRFSKASCVDIRTEIRPHRPRIQVVARPAGTGQGSAISRLPENVSAIRTEEDQELVPRLKCRYPGDQPASQYYPSQGGEVLRAGKLIRVVCNETLLANKKIRTIAQFRIVLISIAQAAVARNASEWVSRRVF